MIPINGDFVQTTKIAFYRFFIGRLELYQSVTLVICLLDSSQNEVHRFTKDVDREQYAAWGTDDSYLEQIADSTVRALLTNVVDPVQDSVEEPVVEPLVEPVVEEPVVEAPVIEEEPVIEEPVVQEEVAVPKLIFIVPYRDREEQRRFFDLQMTKLLEGYQKGEYKIIYSHQQDQRSFNRGAMKNIGFLYAKRTYPNEYQNITFVFNDVDTMPFNKGFINYETTPGVVKHFYGYTFTLGGIVSIKGADFERTNGFPNYWAWGFEDNAFQRRVEQTGLSIDRSQFYPILDKNILQLKDGITRSVNRGEFDRYVNEVLYQTNTDGIQTLSGIVGDYDENTRFLNILSFQTPIAENVELTKSHDLRDGAVPFTRNAQQLAATPGITPVVAPRRGRPRMGMSFFS
jgi:hypothetical protein